MVVDAEACCNGKLNNSQQKAPGTRHQNDAHDSTIGEALGCH